MSFREQHVAESQYDLVRCNRATGSKEVMSGCGPIEGSWEAEKTRKRLEAANRDPNVCFEIQLVKPGTKQFRAAAFGEEAAPTPLWRKTQ